MILLALLFLHTTYVSAKLSGYCSSINGKLEMIQKPPARVRVEVGGTLSLVCSGHGHGMAEPYVYWVKGISQATLPNHSGATERHMGPVAIGKSILFIEKLLPSDIDVYRCVVQDCCSNKTESSDTDVYVDDETCKDVYGVGHVTYGATWQYKSWTDAVQSCKDKGLVIAFPRTFKENQAILADIKKSFKTHPNARKYAHENWVWIGGHDQEVEGQWEMITTGEKVTWKNFERGQPDNWKGRSITHEKGQDCIGMRRTNGKWDDSFIYHKRPYVCQCPGKDDKEDEKDKFDKEEEKDKKDGNDTDNDENDGRDSDGGNNKNDSDNDSGSDSDSGGTWEPIW